MYIKLGTIRANRLYDNPNDYMILSEVPSSGMSFESPVKIRTIKELNIWFGKSYPEYSYLCELLGYSDVTLWLYGAISPQSEISIDLSGYSDGYLEPEAKVDYPSTEVLDDILGKNGQRDGIIFHISGESWIWYQEAWTRVSDLPQNISPKSRSLLNRDTLVISAEIPGIPEYCNPRYHGPSEEDGKIIEEGLDIEPGNFDITWTEGDGVYASHLKWNGEALGKGYLGFKTDSGKWIVCYSGLSLSDAKAALGSIAEYKKTDSVEDIIDTLEDYGYICEAKEQRTWLLRTHRKRSLIDFITFPGISVVPASEDNEELVYSKILRERSGYLQFWSRTIGQDKNPYDLDESRIRVDIEYTGPDGWLIEISRYEYTESYVGNLNSTIEEPGIIDRINRRSRLVRCNLVGNTIREGSWYLSGATPLEPTAEWYKNSMGMLLGTLEDSVCPDFFMIPDLSLYGERKDEQYFLPYATAGEFQYLIHENKEEECRSNYLGDKENRLLYFFGDVQYNEENRPGYYLYLKGILKNDLNLVDRYITYNTVPNQATLFGYVHNPYITDEETLDELKCNYLVCNNQVYYHSKYQNGGDDYITSGTLRFIIGKIYREIQKHRWRIIGQKFNALMENKVTQILQRPSEFSQVKSIEITRFYPQPEQNLLSIEIEVYTRELLKNNITLDVTINYKKD